MTERLYLRDPYVTEFEAEILERRTTEAGLAVLFDATYFYPESGGQPYDHGDIEGIPVRKVLEGDGESVLHFVERFPERDRVRCRIDWERRRDHMQQHSGQHILSAAFVKEAKADTVSFHLGARSSTIDLAVAELSPEDLLRAERTANEAVLRGLAIESRFVAPEEAKTLDLRKPPPTAVSLRIVAVGGFDRQACCGTHPRTSAEVGPIAIRDVQKLKNGTRVEFLCGERVLRDYRETVSRIRSLASLLSSSEADLVATAERFVAERKSTAKELERARTEILLLRVEDWMADARPIGSRLVLSKVLDAPPADLRVAASELTKTRGRVILLGSVAEGRAHLVFAASEDAELDNLDMGALLRSSLDAVDGRGGGSARIAQGGGPRAEGLREALERAVATLSEPR